MSKAIWIWENSAQAEKTEQDVVDTLKQYAPQVKAVNRKVLDGSTFMGAIPEDPGGPIDALHWFSSKIEFAQLGITAVPWGVANSPWDSVAFNTIGSPFIVDLEPYTGFWYSTSNDFNDFLEGIDVQSNVWVSVDPRPEPWEELRVDEWINNSRIAGLMPQLYWSDFVENPWNCVGYLYRCLVSCRNGKAVIPVVTNDSGDSTVPIGSPDNLLAFWRIAQGWGVKDISMWRLGTATISQLERFSNLP